MFEFNFLDKIIMIYHICNPSIYISQFYLFSNKYKIHGNLDFRYIFLEKTDILTNRKDVRYVSFFRLLKLFLLLKNNDRVILHSYSHPFLYVCCFLCFFKLNRFAWVIWGGDLYFYREYKNSLKYRLYEFLRKNTIRRFGYFFNNEKDYILAKKVYQTKGVYFPVGYPQISLKENIISGRPVLNILLGNSADPENNHMEIMDLLSKFSKKDINVFVPLSYGGTKEYISKVVNLGDKLFGNKFIPLYDILPYKAYLKFLDSISIMINNHHRQQGLGNIGYLLSTGAKVYIRSDATSYEELSSKGFIIFDTQLLRAMDFQDFIKMEESNKIVNHNLIYALCSSDVMAKKWEQAFDLILN